MNFIIPYTTFLHLQIQIDVMLTGCSLSNVVNSGALKLGGMGRVLRGDLSVGRKGGKGRKGKG